LLGFTATPLLTQGKTIVIGRVGACGAVNVVEAPCWISDNAMFVSQWYTDCDIDYIALALRSVDLSTFAKKGAQPSISQEAVYSALIPLPPLAEQRHIVAHLQAVQERLKALGEAQAATEAELKRLEQAILEKAFRGEL
jgi:type I restriction enzyme S subunit